MSVVVDKMYVNRHYIGCNATCKRKTHGLLKKKRFKLKNYRMKEKRSKDKENE